MSQHHRLTNAPCDRAKLLMCGVAATFLVLAALIPMATAEAQEATERFIPIGRSPGVSGVLSYIGEITARDAQNNTVTVSGTDGSRTFSLSDSTRIWIDRSSQRTTNLLGERDALQVGRRIEVKFPGPEQRGVAEWIKVAPG